MFSEFLLCVGDVQPMVFLHKLSCARVWRVWVGGLVDVFVRVGECVRAGVV